MPSTYPKPDVEEGRMATDYIPKYTEYKNIDRELSLKL